MDAPAVDSNASPRNDVGKNKEKTISRLMITKMELENFKSYAGVRSIGPFHQCFSSVVGPNGSGKSNVIDAMLFVFGKRAKKLRLNRVSELIHKSDAVKDDPPSYARVSVFFQEIVDTSETEFEVVPGTEMVVSRVARTDNSSSYKLNGKTCQFKDVASYLSSKGIDLDNNRFLILQGEVEMISMMPPKGKNENDEGLLEYLEDIIGSNKFVEETDEVAAKVEVLSESRQEKLQRVKAVEKEKDSLESAKKEAEVFLSKQHEISRTKSILYQLNILDVDEDIEKVNRGRQEVETKLEAEREKLSAADTRVQEIENGLADQRKDYDKIFKELTKTKEEFAAYERRDIKLREEIKHNKALKKKIQQKAAKAEKQEQDAMKKVEQAKKNIPEFETQIQELTSKKSSEDKKLEELQDKVTEETKELRALKDEKNKELSPVKQEQAVFQAALDTAEAEVNLLEDQVKQARERLESSEAELGSLDDSKAKKRTEIDEANEERSIASKRLEEAEVEEATLVKKEEQIAKKTRELVGRCETAKESARSQKGGRSSATKSILNAMKKGGQLEKSGVLGRLGDLASIAAQYDVAVSTACGMLDHIVVETTKGVQKCLQFLKAQNLGRANFIPLDKMKKGAHDQSVETPEGAPRLFELISPSDFSVTPAIFLAVGNTLVAPDLETASRWAYNKKRWRVVTLDGKLIDTAGTMSGGGKGVRRGGMKLTNGSSYNGVEANPESSDELKSLESRVAGSQKLLAECRAARKSVTEEIRTLKKTIKSLDIKVPKLQVEMRGFDSTAAQLTELIPQLKKDAVMSKQDKKKLVDLNRRVDQCKSDMSENSSHVERLEKEVAELQERIMEAGGSELQKQIDMCQRIQTKLSESEKGLQSAKVTISSSEKTLSKAAEARETAATEMQGCKALLETKQTEYQDLEKDALKVMEAYEAVKAIESEKKQALDKIAQECEDLRNSRSKVKVVEVELLGQISTLKKQQGELESKAKHWKNELHKLMKTVQESENMDLSDDEGDDQSTESNEKEWGGDTKKKVNMFSLSRETLEQYDRRQIKEDISVLEAERNTIAKNANMTSIAEYRKKEADYLSRVAELDAVTEERNSMRKNLDVLRRKRLEMFMDGFGQITLKLKEMYQMITLGGDAELELVDSLDPFSEGIVFSVRPPKKSWKNISNLSGGEKTLSSLALVFALHHFKPTPLYVMDEIDAALDFKNVSIVANYIKDRTKNAQFIIISLRNNMFELADRLVGIYKTNNCTKSVTVNPNAFGVAKVQNGLVPATPALGDRSNAKKRRSGSSRKISVVPTTLNMDLGVSEN